MPKHQPFRRQDPEWLRHLVELAICFVIAVIVLRGFFLEGYLISTGSMAPGLRGLHQQLQCPSCAHGFAFGVAFDDSADATAQASQSPDFATCPNCGQSSISVKGVPSAHGDQLLVHKGVFDFRSPRRWETVVFLNPANPSEAYVKRVVGLPGEQLQIVDGDLFVDGRVVRKDVETQRDMRILVSDLSHQPDIADWQLSWRLGSGWTQSGKTILCDDISNHSKTARAESHWINLRNWRWSGGSHVSEVPVNPQAIEADWQTCVACMQDRPISWMTRLEFDREKHLLRLKGVMPWDMQQDLVAWGNSDEFRAAIHRLGALSHVSPVTDQYGYNSRVSSPEVPVRDLMIDTTLEWSHVPELISVRMPIENETIRLDLRPLQNRAVLIVESNGKVLQTLKSANVSADDQQVQLEMSNFDRRISVMLNGTQVFEPVDLPLSVERAQTLADSRVKDDISPDELIAAATAKAITRQSRVGFGVSGGKVTVKHLRLFRDVHYTPGRRKNAVETPCSIAEKNYFVLGDNSPVSFDSRNWPDPFVPHHLLVGKPFIVHLPSRPGKLTLGGLQLPIRIPDFSRIRYIH